MIAILEQVIRYEELVDFEADLAIVTGATFKEDFGPWKQGQVCELIQITVDKDGKIWMEEFCAALCVQRTELKVVHHDILCARGFRE